jgi:hypothetical protein
LLNTFFVSDPTGGNKLGQGMGGGAAQALELMLVEEAVPIRELSLSYNNFRTQHMVRFAKALRVNTFVTHLDLSWNSVGDRGAQIIAESLRTNTYMEVLNVSHDEISEKGAFVLADMLKENHGLKELVLSDNPIGQRGGRAILRSINRMVQLGTANLRHIDLSGCNYNYHTQDEIFDPANPGGDHSCDLSDPYERAKAWELVELAWNEDGENWSNETIDGKPFELAEPKVGEVWGREDYQLPSEGILHVTYLMTPKVPRFTDVVDDEMFEKLCGLMIDPMLTDCGTKLTELAAVDFFFTAEQAASLAILTRDPLNKAIALAALLPRIVDPVNLTADCYDWMSDTVIATLENRAPEMFSFIATNPTGHYKLEVGRPDHRRLLHRLVCICAEEKRFREKYNLIDTSQKGDGEGWRNETLQTSVSVVGPREGDGKTYPPYVAVPWDIDEQDCTGGRLKYGTLEFDFVGTSVKGRITGAEPMPNKVFSLFIKELLHMADNVTVAGKYSSTSVEAKKSANYDKNRKKVLAKTKELQHVLYFEKHAHSFKPEGAYGMNDLMLILKMQGIMRGKLLRRSVEGMSLIPYARALRLAVPIIASERELMQAFRKHRSKKIQVARQEAKLKAKLAGDRGADGQNSPVGASNDEARRAMLTVNQLRGKIKPARRACWWTPSQAKKFEVSSWRTASNIICTKQLQMLRRATMQYFFSSKQVERILSAMEPGLHAEGHVEALTTLFSVITDIESMDFPTLLGHESYDTSGDGMVDWNELEAMRLAKSPWVSLEHNLGPANLFNPIRPEREYALDLRKVDERLVAECLIILGGEPGENLLSTTYNVRTMYSYGDNARTMWTPPVAYYSTVQGMPFDISAKWLTEVPSLVGLHYLYSATPRVR